MGYLSPHRFVVFFYFALGVSVLAGFVGGIFPLSFCLAVSFYLEAFTYAAPFRLTLAAIALY